MLKHSLRASSVELIAEHIRTSLAEDAEDEDENENESDDDRKVRRVGLGLVTED